MMSPVGAVAWTVLFVAAWGGAAEEAGARGLRAVSPVVEELVRLGVFERIVVLCGRSASAIVAPSDDDEVGLVDGACERHMAGGGGWPDDLQSRVEVVRRTPRGDAVAAFLCLRAEGVPKRVRMGYVPLDAPDVSWAFCRKQLELLSHLEVARSYGRNASTLVVLGDSVDPSLLELGPRPGRGEARLAAAAIRRALRRRPWEVLRLSGTFVHALSPKPRHRGYSANSLEGRPRLEDGDAATEDPAYFGGGNRTYTARLAAQEATCRPRGASRPVDLSACACPEACACARAAGGRLCAAAASPGRQRPRETIKRASSTFRRCDVRDLSAYAFHPKAANAASDLYGELTAAVHAAWAKGRHVPTFEAYVAARFDALYALPPLAAAPRFARSYAEDGVFVADRDRRRVLVAENDQSPADVKAQKATPTWW